MSKEIWKNIKGYEGLYQISNLGRIKSYDRYTNSALKNTNKILRKGKILKQSNDGNGYLQIILNKDGKRKGFKVHKLVAQIFLDKRNFKCMPYEDRETVKLDSLEVNHINEFEKYNNSVNNLEWCTRLYNCNYATRNQRVNSWKNGNRKRKEG